VRRVKVTGLRNLKTFGCHFKVIVPTLVAEQTDYENEIQSQREIVNKQRMGEST